MRGDGAPRRVEDFDDPCVCPVFSADGAYLYFARDDHGSECFDVYRCELADGTLVNLLPDTPTLSPAPDFALSPDGRRLALAVNHGASSIDGRDAGRAGRRRRALSFLTDHWYNDWSPRYSPDGALLAFRARPTARTPPSSSCRSAAATLRAIGGDDDDGGPRPRLVARRPLASHSAAAAATTRRSASTTSNARS